MFNYMMTVFEQETKNFTEDQKTEKFMDRDFMKMCGEKAKAWNLRDLEASRKNTDTDGGK